MDELIVGKGLARLYRKGLVRLSHLAFQVCHRPKSSKSGQIHEKDAQWAETNKKSI